MPKVTAIQTNFTAGELSPKLYSRVDIEKYRNGAQELTNFQVERFGGVRKRGGTEYIASVKTASKNVRLIPFIFSVTQAYVLEFGDTYIRLFLNGGAVESGGSPVEVTSPWDETEVDDLQFAQSGDILYITHPDYSPRQFVRNSATSFTLSEVDFEDGPYLPFVGGGTIVTPADHADAVPVMTSNTAPSGTASDSAASANAYKAFDKDKTTNVTFVGTSGWIQFQQAASAQVVVDAYFVTAYGDVAAGDLGGGSPGFPGTPGGGNQVPAMENTPANWKFQGSNDGSTWVTIDAQNEQFGWSPGETRFFKTDNTTAYEYHRLIWTAVAGGSNAAVGSIGMHLAVDDQTAFNLTASAVTGINDDQGFQTTDVGRHIRLFASDGEWRWAKIVARTSTTVVTIKLYDHALPDLDAIQNWRLGAWSDESGWPKTVTFFRDRLVFGRTTKEPQTVWFSQVDDFTNFATSSPVLDTDAITATISSGQVNSIEWLLESSDVFLGTSGAIRTIGPNTETGGFAPTNIKQKRETTYGAGSPLPVQIGTAGIYSGYYRRDIREISYSFDVDGYVSTELSILAEHLLKGKVKQIAYAQTPDSVVWMCTDDGGLVGMTYERDQNVVAFHEHEFSNAVSGDFAISGDGTWVESICTIPGTDRDELWLAIKRVNNSTTFRYIERLSVGYDSDTGLASATFLDSHLNYSGAGTTTITGLDHLEGANVYVWGTSDTLPATTAKQGPFTVSSGSITITSSVGTACVGLPYTSAIETLSPEAATQGGTAQTRLGHTSEVFLRLDNSQDGKVGPAESDDYDTSVGTLETIPYDDTSVFSGDKRVPIEQSWQRNKRIRITHDEPTPFNLLGMIYEIRVTG